MGGAFSRGQRGSSHGGSLWTLPYRICVRANRGLYGD
nr:MAG TPA: hypothetical protein [Caudoviricetes sp.]